MRIQFNGHDFDLNDSAALNMASLQHAEELVRSLMEKGDEMDALDALTTLLAGIIRYHLASGATLAMARSANVAGISLRQALDQHNFIGALIGQPELDLLLDLEEAPPAPVLVDQKGRPIPPGQQDLPLATP